MKMSAILFFFLLALVDVARVAVGSECQSGQTIPSTIALYENLNACAYPTQNLNKSCVSASCLTLASSKVCPTKNDRSFDSQSVMTQINECFKSMSTLCGAPWDPIAVPPNSLVLDAGVATVSCSLLTGGVTTTGLKRTSLGYISLVDGTFSLAFRSPNIDTSGEAQCVITVPSLALGLSIPPVTVALTATYASAYTSAATVDAGASPPTVTLTSSQATSTMTVNPSPQATTLVTSAINVLSKLLESLAAKNDADPAFPVYAATFAAYALQVLTDNCPQAN